MQVNSLRELAAAYARGDIGRDDYRRTRSDLIAAVLRGEVQLRVNDYAPPPAMPDTDQQDVTTPRSRTRPVSPEPAAAREAREAAKPVASAPAARPAWLLPVAAGAVLVIGAAVFLAGGDEEPGPAAPPVTGTAMEPGPSETVAVAAVPVETAEAPVAGADGAAGRALISAFLEDKDWSPARREAFLAEWSGLSQEERDAARNSVEQGQLASAIYKKLLEERALSGLGDREAAEARERELTRFAEQIGIDDPRLKPPDNVGGDAGSAVPAIDDHKPLSVTRGLPQGTLAV